MLQTTTCFENSHKIGFENIIIRFERTYPLRRSSSLVDLIDNAYIACIGYSFDGTSHMHREQYIFSNVTRDTTNITMSDRYFISIARAINRVDEEILKATRFPWTGSTRFTCCTIYYACTAFLQLRLRMDVRAIRHELIPQQTCREIPAKCLGVLHQDPATTDVPAALARISPSP